jgi:uncharacterized protein YqjF (DUF2071 family)
MSLVIPAHGSLETDRAVQVFNTVTSETLLGPDMKLLSEAAAQARSVEEVGHRPWPLNPRSWLMGQTWERLLFAHWRVDADALRPHVPGRLEIEQHEGSAWLGITPFRLTSFRLRGLPPAPGLSSFLELNCRTYVRWNDRPGIWFFSLDASSRLAVEAARRTYGLPYRQARIEFEAGTFTVSRFREDSFFSASYEPLGAPYTAGEGSLEHFLVERYCLYGGKNGELRADIHHLPWQLQKAEVELEHVGISPLPIQGEPLAHYAHRQDVVIWSPEQLA